MTRMQEVVNKEFTDEFPEWRPYAPDSSEVRVTLYLNAPDTVWGKVTIDVDGEGEGAQIELHGLNISQLKRVVAAMRERGSG